MLEATSAVKKAKILFVIILLSVFLCPSTAFAKKHHKIVKHAHSLVDGAASYADIVIDAESGQVLHATDADQLRHPASLTKMMTLYLTFQALEAGKLGLNQFLPVSTNAAEQPPSKLGLRPGKRIRAEDAILGLVTESANDAAMVLAEWLGGNEQGFARMMTRQARSLGMNHTRYNNPSGLPDPGQVTTARDMAVLGHALIYHFPQFYPYFSRDDFVYAGIDHHNHNHLMDRYEGMDGIKTGYIRASGFNLVASARHNDVRLIGVVFGGRSTTARDNRMAQLLDQSFASALHDKSEPRPVAYNVAQGDSNDDDTNENGNYVALPAKVAIAFPSAGAGKPLPHDNPMTGGDWGIQIGAYSDPSIGQQALANVVANMPQVLGSADPQVQKVDTNGVSMYRARLMSLDQKTAQSTCAWLIKRGQTCLTVGP
jgi:D-alanyl-D-alanine carboxypeptidase